MQSAQAELKAIAKTMRESLARSGFAVQHTAVLKALACALNKRDWQKLKAGGTAKSTVSTLLPLTNHKKGPEYPQSKTVVNAQFWTDNRAFEINFDARLGLEQLSDADLRTIIGDDYWGSYSLDDVAVRMRDHHEKLDEAFTYLETINGPSVKNLMGFEVRVNPRQLLAWMLEQKKALLATYLGYLYSVRLIYNKESPLQTPSWIWMSEDGKQCSETFFDSVDAAYLDAFEKLSLFDKELAELTI